jgi:ribonuclease VapC
MVLDSSAVLAILLSEPQRRAFIEALDADPVRLLSVASLTECSIVIAARFGADGLRDLDQFVARASIQLEPVDAEQSYVARDAWQRFGKGRHAAALNYGDCFVYALAYVTGEALLCTGHDFAQTDIALHPASTDKLHCDLDGLLSGITKHNADDEVSFGRPVGKESL